jgi:hypothetical protein
MDLTRYVDLFVPFDLQDQSVEGGNQETGRRVCIDLL